MPASLSPRILVALTVAFVAAVYTATQHKPTPHALRVGAVGQETPLKLRAALSMPPNNPSYFEFTEYETADELKTAIKERKIYAGFELKDNKGELFIAPAAGKVLSDNLALTATALM